MTDAPAKPRLRWPLSLIVGATLTAVVLLTALLALVWTPYDVEAVDIAAKLTAPSAAHWMGTDHFGRDVLSMIMAGAQNSLVVAFVAVGIGVAIGTPLGLTAAARGGWVDELVMR
ncbi:MAG TPA: ABC transporter permease, partial [Brevundimonas sp.]